jgi:hypothetical protein
MGVECNRLRERGVAGIRSVRHSVLRALVLLMIRHAE